MSLLIDPAMEREELTKLQKDCYMALLFEATKHGMQYGVLPTFVAEKCGHKKQGGSWARPKLEQLVKKGWAKKVRKYAYAISVIEIVF